MKFWITTIALIVIVTVGFSAWMALDANTPIAPLGGRAPAEREGGANPDVLDDDDYPKFTAQTLEQTVHDVAQFTEGTVIFPVSNTGSDKLRLTKSKVSCTCAGAGFRRSESEEIQPFVTLQPGEAADFVVDWNSKDRLGTFVVSALVTSNDPNNPEITFKLSLNIRHDLVVSPIELKFGHVSPGEQVTKISRVFSNLENEVKVTDVACTSEAFEIRLVPLSEEEKQRIEAKSGMEIHAIYDGSLPEGPFNHRANFTAAVGEKTHQRTLLLTGEVPRSIQSIPSNLDMKVVSRKSAQPKEVKVFAHRLKEGQSLVVQKVEPSFLQTELTHDPKFNTLWHLKINVAPQAELGKFVGSITIKSDEGQSVTIRVKGFVSDA